MSEGFIVTSYSDGKCLQVLDCLGSLQPESMHECLSCGCQYSCTIIIRQSETSCHACDIICQALLCNIESEEELGTRLQSFATDLL